MAGTKPTPAVSMVNVEYLRIDAAAGCVNVFKFAGAELAIPAWWAYQYFATCLESFQVEMKNGSSELLDYLNHRPELQA